MITTASESTLWQAMSDTNKHYSGNLTFKQVPIQIGRKTRFTLTVCQSSGPGARRGQSGKRMAAACWHAHGDFYDAVFALEPTAIIQAGGNTIDRSSVWQHDWNIGSQMRPLMYSDACDCGKVPAL